jgi:hypothetical protein
VALERPAVHRLAVDAVTGGEPLGALAAVQLDRVDALVQLGVRVHRRQHVAALLDDGLHVHAVPDGRDAEVGHAVEAAGEEDVAEPAGDLHRRHVHRHHGRRARALDAQPDHVIREPGEERDRRARVRLLAHHLDRAQDDGVDVPRRDPRPAEAFVQHDHREVVGSDLPEDAAPGVGPAKRRAHVPHQERVPQLAHARRAIVARCARRQGRGTTAHPPGRGLFLLTLLVPSS